VTARGAAVLEDEATDLLEWTTGSPAAMRRSARTVRDAQRRPGETLVRLRAEHVVGCSGS
jgi:hypothetical protein